MSGGKTCFECRGDENRAIISEKEFTRKRVVGNQSARAPLFLALLILTMSVTACGPTLGFPGGRLTGILAPEPVSNWRFSDETEIVQLETRLSRPYSTNIWGVNSGAAFFISFETWRSLLGLADARWVAHIADDPRVRLRIGETLYERKAVRVRDGPELASVLMLIESKWRPPPLRANPSCDRG